MDIMTSPVESDGCVGGKGARTRDPLPHVRAHGVVAGGPLAAGRSSALAAGAKEHGSGVSTTVPLSF